MTVITTIHTTPARWSQKLLVAPRPLASNEQEYVLAGDLGQARHDHDVGGDDAPAAHPAVFGPERPGPPGESGPAVGVGVVHLLVAVGDDEHRDEGQDQ